MAITQQQLSNAVVSITGIIILNTTAVIAFVYGPTYIGCTLATIAIATTIYMFYQHASILMRIERVPTFSTVH